MVSWGVILSREATKDAKKLSRAGLQGKAPRLLEILRTDPLTTPPPYEKVVGDLKGCYSRRINPQHRLVCSIDQERRIVKVLRMWTHYE